MSSSDRTWTVEWKDAALGRHPYPWKSDFLFVQPTFIGGMASALDLFGAFDLLNTSRSPVEADRRALMCDRRVVYRDIRKAVVGTLRKEGLAAGDEQLTIFDQNAVAAAPGR